MRPVVSAVLCLAACERSVVGPQLDAGVEALVVDAGAVDAGAPALPEQVNAALQRMFATSQQAPPVRCDEVDPEDGEPETCVLGIPRGGDDEARVRSIVEDAHYAANGWESRAHELWLVPLDGGAPVSTVVLGSSSSSSIDGESTNERSVDVAALRGGKLVVRRTSRLPQGLRRRVSSGRLTLMSHRGQLVPDDVGTIRHLDAKTDGCVRFTAKPGPMNSMGPGCWADERDGFCLAVANACEHAIDVEGLVRRVPGGSHGTRETTLVAQPCVVPAREHALLKGAFRSAVEGFAFWVPRCATRNVSSEVAEHLETVDPSWRVHFEGDEIIAVHPTNETVRLIVAFEPQPYGAPNRVAIAVRVIGLADAQTQRLREHLEALSIR